MNNTNLEALERAVAVAEGLQPDVGYDVLLAAAKRFIRASRGSQPCPTCGAHYQGAHFCPGRSFQDIAYPGGGGPNWRNRQFGGIEYWNNQPTSIAGETKHSSVGQAQDSRPEGSHSFTLTGVGSICPQCHGTRPNCKCIEGKTND